MGAIFLHLLRLPRQRLRLSHMAHHQETGDIHSRLAGEFDMLARDVRLGAVRGDTNRNHAQVQGTVQVFDGANPRDQ